MKITSRNKSESARNVILATFVLFLCACASRDKVTDDALLDLDTPTLAAMLGTGQVSAEQVASLALKRIATLDDSGPMLNAIIEINPEALIIARALDKRFAGSGPVGPLHGLPVVLKANIDTGDRMATTAGSLALANHFAEDDAEIVERLRQAGAVIIAKANLSEWANFRDDRSSSGWSSLGGQTRNPYVLDRNPCGSSSGSAVAVAARLTPLAVGTETGGSIVCPAGANGVVGIKPTFGSVPQDGIIPIAHSRDIAGPMARTVRGAALMLAIMQDREAYQFNRRDLNGLRIGAVADYSGAGSSPEIEAMASVWQEWLGRAGADVISPLSLEIPPSVGAANFQVLLFEFKADLNKYLAEGGVSPASLAELINFNAANADTVMPYFGQSLMLAAQDMAGLDSPDYQEVIMQSGEVMQELLTEVFNTHNLDAIIAPVNSPAWVTDLVNGDNFSLSSANIAAVSGFPNVAIPAGFILGLPVSVAIIGKPGSEDLLLEIAAVFESIRGPMPAPSFLPALAY